MTFDELLSTYEPRLAAAFREAIETIKSTIVLGRVVERLERGDINGAVGAMQIEPEAFSALTRAMAADHLREGIRVNAVNPGTADTPWVGRLLDQAADPAAERAALEARQPHGRLVSPQEVAAAVAYLVGPDVGSTTGTFIEVDGGLAQLRLRAE